MARSALGQDPGCSQGFAAATRSTTQVLARAVSVFHADTFVVSLHVREGTPTQVWVQVEGAGAAFLGVAPEGSSITRVFWRTSAIVGERGSGQAARLIASSRLAETEGLGVGREGFAGICCPLAHHDIKHLPSDSVPSHLNPPRSLSTDQPDSGTAAASV